MKLLQLLNASAIRILYLALASCNFCLSFVGCVDIESLSNQWTTFLVFY